MLNLRREGCDGKTINRDVQSIDAWIIGKGTFFKAKQVKMNCSCSCPQVSFSNAARFVSERYSDFFKRMITKRYNE